MDGPTNRNAEQRALYSLVVANGLLIVEEGVRHVPAGTAVQVQLLH
ncbi:MAG: hypothetical protein HND48_11825 [Chloroflexi bacterium]|nr:hypothetical protein [Chloroflexota bacterium]